MPYHTDGVQGTTWVSPTGIHWQHADAPPCHSAPLVVVPGLVLGQSNNNHTPASGQGLFQGESSSQSPDPCKAATGVNLRKRALQLKAETANLHSNANDLLTKAQARQLLNGVATPPCKTTASPRVFRIANPTTGKRFAPPETPHVTSQRNSAMRDFERWSTSPAATQFVSSGTPTMKFCSSQLAVIRSRFPVSVLGDADKRCYEAIMACLPLNMSISTRRSELQNIVSAFPPARVSDR